MRFIQYMHPAAQARTDASGLCPANPGPRHQRKFFQVASGHWQAAPHAQVQEAIAAAVAPSTLRAAVLFDVYRPKPVKGADAAPTTGLAPGEKSLAVRLTLGSGEVTLTEADIDAAVQAVVAQLAAQTGARLRV